MIAAVAVVTEQGGATSHAAVVSRALDTPCVVGCGPGTVDRLVGRTVTVDATKGLVYDGVIPTSAVEEGSDDDLRRLTAWADQVVSVRVDADGAGAVDPVFDADTIPPEELGEHLPAIPPGTRTVRGAVFATPDGVRAALDAGVEVIVAPHRLPVLLTADRPPGRNDMSTAQTEPAGSDLPESATFRAVQEIIRTFQGSGWTGMTLDVSGLHITLGKHGRPAGPVGGPNGATAAPAAAARPPPPRRLLPSVLLRSLPPGRRGSCGTHLTRDPGGVALGTPRAASVRSTRPAAWRSGRLPSARSGSRPAPASRRSCRSGSRSRRTSSSRSSKS